MALRLRRCHRKGFALLVVLWVMVGVAVLGATVASLARDSVAAAQNRVDLLRAFWRADGCAEIARSVIGESLVVKEETEGTSGRWTMLDQLVASSSLLAGCSVVLRGSGRTIDANTSDSMRIRAVLVALGEPLDRTDSLMDALLDWRDTDNIARPRGAESDWYSAQHRPSPGNRPIASIEELRLVRGFNKIGGLDTIFGIESERIDLNSGPLPILASLPGFDSSLLQVVAAYRARHERIADLAGVGTTLSGTLREGLLTHHSELIQLATSTPDAWILTSRMFAGSPPAEATVELRLVNAGRRAAIVRRRSWP